MNRASALATVVVTVLVVASPVAGVVAVPGADPGGTVAAATGAHATGGAPAAASVTTAAGVTVNGTITYENNDVANATTIEFRGSGGATNVTDANGKYAVGVTSGETYDVVWFQDDVTSNADVAYPKDGRADVYAYGEESYSSDTTMNRSVPVGHRLNVTVVDGNGAAVKGVQVVVTHENNGSFASLTGTTNATGVAYPSSAGAGFEVNGSVDVSVRDPDGAYTDNFTDLTVTSPQSVTLTVYESTNVTGTVTYPNGTSASNVTLIWANRNVSAGAGNVTDDQGRFSVRIAKNDTHDVLFWQADTRNEPVSFPRDDVPDFLSLGQFNYSADDVTENVGLPNGATLNVTVEDESGNKIKDARVNLVHENASGNTGNPAFSSFYGYKAEDGVTTDSQGRMIHAPNGIAGVEVNGSVDVNVEPPTGTNYQRNGTRVTVTGDTEETVVLENRVRVNGTLVRADSNPAAADEVVAYWSGDGDGNVTDANGNYELLVEPGVDVNATYEQDDPRTTSDTAYPKDGNVDVWALGTRTFSSDTDLGTDKLPVGHQLNVTVEDAAGNPIENATVAVVHFRDRAAVAVEANTTASGAMVHPESDGPGVEVNSSQGTVAVVVRPPDGSEFGNASTNVSLSADKNITLVLPRPVDVVGSVKYPDGTAAANESTVVTGTVDNATTTNATGAFVFRDLRSPGTYNVSHGQIPATQLENRDRLDYVLKPHDGVADLEYVGSFSNVTNGTTVGPYTLSKGHVVNVTVVDGSGTPVNNATVVVGIRKPDGTLVENHVGRNTLTDPDGMVYPSNQDAGFELNGSYEVTVIRPRNSTAFAPEFERRNVTVSGSQNLSYTVNRTDVSPRSHDFGSVTVGDTASKTITVTNDGDFEMRVAGTSVVGADSGAFSVTSGGGSFTLSPGQSRKITVEFAPGSSGSKSAALRLDNPQPAWGPPLTVSVSGDGDSASTATPTPTPDPYGDAHADPYGDAHADPDSDRDAVPDADGHPHGDADGHPERGRHADGGRDADADRDGRARVRERPRAAGAGRRRAADPAARLNASRTTVPTTARDRPSPACQPAEPTPRTAGRLVPTRTPAGRSLYTNF